VLSGESGPGNGGVLGEVWGMGAASLLLASLMWTAGADLPPEVWMKTRQVVIPIQLKPERQNEVRELLLFVSTDEGKSWNQEARVTPDKKGFRFGAPTDGRYWFTVCDVDFNGRRTPQDLNGVPPGLIINIDTRPPLVKFRSSDRIGDEISVVWHIEEENPDPSTLKLEFRPASDETAPWNNVPITPGPDGQAKFHVNTPGPVMVRMSFQDRAANQAQAINVVGANASSTSGYGAGAHDRNNAGIAASPIADANRLVVAGQRPAAARFVQRRARCRSCVQWQWIARNAATANAKHAARQQQADHVVVRRVAGRPIGCSPCFPVHDRQRRPDLAGGRPR